MKNRFLALSILLSILLVHSGCSPRQDPDDLTQGSKPAGSGIRKVSFVLTNDIHGHLEPAKPNKRGKRIGGLGYLATYVKSLRSLPEYASQETPLFVLDSGDQFQGTLLSNYDEGKSVYEALNAIGYDAVIPGNHDYDFGPIGWLYDRVSAGKTSDNPREVIEGLAKSAKFPLLSANTYLKKTIRIKSPTPVELNSSCEPKDRSLRDALDFTTAEHPSFLTPYVIIEKSGLRVALIGLDNKSTASTTTAENVSDLCFRDEAETYIELRKALEGKADLFVILMHNGNSDNSKEGSAIAAKINAAIPNGVDLVAAGHTHFVHDHVVDGVHVVQDGSEARGFGRVDLFFDTATRKVLKEQTRAWAGQELNPEECKIEPKTRNAFICEQYPSPLASEPAIDAIIAKLRADIAPLASRKILMAAEPITRSRTDESAMTNILTDALRKATGADISFMNTGGIRTDLPKGDILYEDFFEVIPFANQTAIVNQAPWSLVKRLLEDSTKTCGAYGALLFSGLKVQYSRTCAPDTNLDQNAKLLRVETLSGEVLFDAASGTEASANRTFKVATLDFIAAGGSGYSAFTGTKVDSYPGLAREMIADQLAKDNLVVKNEIDGRFKQVAPSGVTPERAKLNTGSSAH